MSLYIYIFCIQKVFCIQKMVTLRKRSRCLSQSLTQNSRFSSRLQLLKLQFKNLIISYPDIILALFRFWNLCVDIGMAIQAWMLIYIFMEDHGLENVRECIHYFYVIRSVNSREQTNLILHNQVCLFTLPCMTYLLLFLFIYVIDNNNYCQSWIFNLKIYEPVDYKDYNILSYRDLWKFDKI